MKARYYKYISIILLMAMFMISDGAIAASGIGSIGKPLFTENKSLIYDRATNPYIGITPDESTKGSTFQVTNENGKTVYSGKIVSSKTFYISTGKLGTGYFYFYINGFMVQQFFVS